MRPRESPDFGVVDQRHDVLNASKPIRDPCRHENLFVPLAGVEPALPRGNLILSLIFAVSAGFLPFPGISIDAGISRTYITLRFRAVPFIAELVMTA